MAKAMAAEYQIAWLRPAAPQEGGTRTAAFEIQRVPPVFLNNFMVYFLSLVALLRVGPQAEKRKLAQLGHELTDPALLIFIVTRYEARRPLLRFTQVAQQVHKAGFERIRQQETVAQELDANVATLHCLVGLVGVVGRVFAACAPWDSGATHRARQFYAGLVASCRRFAAVSVSRQGVTFLVRGPCYSRGPDWLPPCG